jgi:hypothetical protein
VVLELGYLLRDVVGVYRARAIGLEAEHEPVGRHGHPTQRGPFVHALTVPQEHGHRGVVDRDLALLARLGGLHPTAAGQGGVNHQLPGLREQARPAQAHQLAATHPGHGAECERRRDIGHHLQRGLQVAAELAYLGRHMLTGHMPAGGQLEVGHRTASDDPPALRPPKQRRVQLRASFIRDALRPARRIRPKIRSMVASSMSRSLRRPISGENHLLCTLR